MKICGLTHPDDALMAADAGADMLGMVFYPPSPRAISPQRAREIVQAVRAAGFAHVRLVAVTVNAPPAFLRYLLDEVGVDLVQLHGEEPPANLAALAGRGYKALRLRGEEDWQAEVARFASVALQGGPQLLLDAAVPHAYGGTGYLADWEVARAVARQADILLAGGLSPDNVAEAVCVVQPWGVDVSSGVEAAPGRKDPARVRAFIQAARGR